MRRLERNYPIPYIIMHLCKVNPRFKTRFLWEEQVTARKVWNLILNCYIYVNQNKTIFRESF